MILARPFHASPSLSNRNPMYRFLPLALAGLGSLASAQGSLVVPSGEYLILNTSQTPTLVVDEFIIEENAYVRVTGNQPLILLASQRVVLDGQLVASGANGSDLESQLFGGYTGLPGIGVAAGGDGGVGSPKPTGESLEGAPGLGIFDIAVPWGGKGGEAALLMTNNALSRQGAGGGGGRFAADEPIQGALDDPANRGLVAAAGADGSLTAFGAVSLTQPPSGGAPGDPVFTDTSADNDFFGSGWSSSGQLVSGELLFPLAGSGGGGGGDSLNTNVVPAPGTLAFNKELSGAGGGGGGGLVLIATQQFSVGPAGQLVADGGRGGRGESSNFLNGVGGGGGGGSGGMILVQAATIDLAEAAGECFSARGGLGGPGLDFESFESNHGGMGGPGLVQLHVPDPNLIQLPAGSTLAELTAPDAAVLQPLPVVLP